MYGGTGGFVQSLISFVPNPSTSASHTFTMTQFSTFPSIVVLACSGTTTVYPLASQNGFNSPISSTGSFQTGSVTPVETGDLIIAAFAANLSSSISPSINDSFNTPVFTTNASFDQAAISWLAAPSGSAINPTWTVGQTGTNFASQIAVFKVASASPPAMVGPVIKKIAGVGQRQGYSGDGGQANSAQLYWPSEMVLDSSGNLIFADIDNNVIRIINNQATTQTLYNVSVCAGCIQTIAGNGTNGFVDNVQGVSAELAHPVGMAIDSSNNVYVADQQNHRIRKIATTGLVSTVAGSGASTNGACSNGSFSGNGGPATSATLACPQGVAVDISGNIYIADSGNFVIRAVNVQATTQVILNVSIPPGAIQTVAGTHNTAGSTGNGGPAVSALLNQPLGMGLDASKNLYFADVNNNQIRKVSTAGVITAFAGTGTAGYSGDGGTATSSKIDHPFDVKFDNTGNSYIADTYNSVIRKINTFGTISTIAGNFAVYGFIASGPWSAGGYGGNNGPANLAMFCGNNGQLIGPVGVYAKSGSLYIGDTGNNVIWQAFGGTCPGVCVGSGIDLANGISIH